MISSVESFANFEASKKILILGDMLELGDDSPMHHAELLKKIRTNIWTDVVLVGQLFGAFAKQFSEFQFFESLKEANKYLDRSYSEGTSFLVKGSRGIALEKLKLIQQLQ
jgi:UDP-N-acetylmuramoyl-tripeptide--D-alanyl-D-alanine ligase